MEVIVNILILITFKTIWIDEFYLLRINWKLNFKPLNCSFCLTFWCSVALSIIFMDATYLIAALMLRVIENKLL